MSRGVQRWQVEPDGPRTLGEVLRALGVEERALSEGRVFVKRRRASDVNEQLEVGSSVEVFAARPGEEPARVVERVDGFVIAYKPAALPTEADRSGHACLTREIAALIGAQQVHAVSRLDVGVSGLVLLSESRTAHQRAARLREQGAISRAYVAVAERAPTPEHGSVSTPVEGRPASTRYVAIARALPHRLPSGERVSPALLTLWPETGRKHQLRLHARELGAPLLGDRAHGGARRLATESGSVLEVPRVMLHAARVELPRASGEPWVVVAPPPGDFAEIWLALGGERADLERASAMR